MKIYVFQGGTVSSLLAATASAELIDSRVRESVINKLVNENGYEHDHAAEIFDATVQFLDLASHDDLAALSPLFSMAAASTGGKLVLSPSRQVDDGWHQFIIHTKAYADFCEAIAGRFIHHTPDEISDGGQSVPAFEVLKAMGVEYNPEIWESTSAWCGCGNCGDCSSD